MEFDIPTVIGHYDRRQRPRRGGAYRRSGELYSSVHLAEPGSFRGYGGHCRPRKQIVDQRGCSLVTADGQSHGFSSPLPVRTGIDVFDLSQKQQ